MLILSYLLLFALSCICFLMTSVFANSDQSASFIHVRSGQNVYAKTSSAKVQSLHSRQIKPKSQLRTESYPRHAKATALMSLVDRTGSVGSPDIEIEKISGWKNYEEIVSSADGLIVVKFMAQYCRSCKAVDRKYKKLALSFPNVKFYEVDALMEEEIAFKVNVPALPSAVIYGSGQELENMVCGPKTFDDLIEKVSYHSSALGNQGGILDY
eukprot:CAMPEP_0117832886 /NCGR_PEP_ID=MMETSP0949-20121206/10001_1 /TAXON_ID=44440 /ORGANISM="Chattonella subsalsa, Strain CCMP2191" /LENGTH=211 /DNA_ID=CAMNT_0005674459 /DNA_START=108 /DNA_END=743 /DNA_ORIENTATION=+